MFFGLTDKSIMGGRIAATDAARANPMERVIEAVRLGGMPLTFGSLLQQAETMGVHASQRGNLSGLDVSGFTFTEADVKSFQQTAGEGAEIRLNGSNISGCVFRPASTFNGCVIDQCTIANSDMTSLRFEGLTDQANLKFANVDVSGMTITGAKATDAARNVNVTLDHAVARDMNIAGSGLLKLNATQTDLQGLVASDSRGLQVTVEDGNLQGANFDRVSFAPGSRLHGNLTGASFKGSDLSHVDMRESTIQPENLYGGYIGTTEITAQNVHQVMQEKGLKAAEPTAQVANVPLKETDMLIEQMFGARIAASSQATGWRAADQQSVAAQAALAQFAKPEAGTGLSV